LKSDGAGSTIAFRDGEAQTVRYLINLDVAHTMVSTEIVRNTAGGYAW